jgi:diguanylate cyclase (GGDEF)-like protein
MSEVTVEKLMTRTVTSVKPDASLAEVAATMSQARISCLVVCREGAPVGIITERDLVGAAVPSLSGSSELPASAEELMSSPVITLPLSAPLADAVTLARARRVRHLPVLDERGRLAGLVTQTDLLNAYMEYMEHLVLGRTAELAEANRKLELLSLRDGLLGIGNRRAMEESLARVHDLAARYDRPYAVALFDVDHFKRYNDTYGHLAGDEALKRVASCIAETARGADHAYRYGGEEILVILPETRLDNAIRAAQRICDQVRALTIAHEGSPLRVLTVSCGVGSVEGRACPWPDWRGLLRDADLALYRAKREGRDRVVRT